MRRVIFLLVLIILGSSFASYIYAEDSKKLSIAEIIANVQKATDPDGITLKMKTKIQKGIIDMPAQNFKVKTTVMYSLPDKCKLVSKFSTGQEDIQIIVGSKACEIKDGKVREIKGQELDYMIFNTQMDSFRTNWKKLFKKVELEKDQKVKGKDCYVIKCIPADEYKIETDVTIYIDKKSFLVLETDMSAYSEAGVLREKIFVDKYENMAGIMVPVKTETDIFGAKIVYTVTDVKLNSAIEESNFELPKSK